jgi:membrane fusion protein (multidrug efflux system)
VQATVPNSREEILPGMFGSVHFDIGSSTSLLIIPAISVAYAPYGNSVYVVERKRDVEGKEITTVRQQIVQLGRSRGDFISVTKGLNEGEEIVATGAFKLRPGAQIQIREDGTPPLSLEPKVENR